MSSHGNRIGKSVMIATMLLAWFGLTNHCALAAMPATAPAACAECPMHPMTQKAPAEQKECGDNAPCCKNLSALVSPSMKSSGDFVATVTPLAYPAALVVAPPTLVAELAALDTGPPLAQSFAEQILQRSLLAHAPPVSA